MLLPSSFRIALRAIATSLLLASSAAASVTVDLIWADTGTPSATVDRADLGNHTCDGFFHSQVGHCMKIVWTVGPEGLLWGSTSVSKDGLIASTYHPSFKDIPVGKSAVFRDENLGGSSSVHAAKYPLHYPGFLPPGTYTVGTIIWSPYGAEPGTHNLEPSATNGWGFADSTESSVTTQFNGATLHVQAENAAEGNGRMYWADNKIRRAALDGTNVETILDEGGGPVALDLAGGKIYWAGDKIRRADLDGSNVEDLVALGDFFDFRGLALDLPSGKIYWTEAWEIRRANLDGSAEEVVIAPPVGHGIGVAPDSVGGKIYWTDLADNVQRSNLDGSNVEVLATGQIGPHGIALDRANGKLYWADIVGIHRADLDGSDAEVVVTGIPGYESAYAISLDLAGGKLYWTHPYYFPGGVQRADLGGSNSEMIVLSSAYGPTSIGLDFSVAASVPALGTWGAALLSVALVGTVVLLHRSRRSPAA